MNDSFTQSIILITLWHPLPVFSNSYMLDTSPNRQKGMQIGKGGAKSDTPFGT